MLADPAPGRVPASAHIAASFVGLGNRGRSRRGRRQRRPRRRPGGTPSRPGRCSANTKAAAPSTSRAPAAGSWCSKRTKGAERADPVDPAAPVWCSVRTRRLRSSTRNPYTYASVYLNDWYTNDYAADQRQSVAAHELGHALGLDHTSGAVLMNPVTCGPSSRWCTYGIKAPTADEVNGINSLYDPTR
ncbi:MAG TPA: matrixin family metalloprotease [Candidatus Binatia bacterium]|nr:matrixin family metalloprotease [Candidatus Binatia bacterium]